MMTMLPKPIGQIGQKETWYEVKDNLDNAEKTQIKKSNYTHTHKSS